MMGYVVLTIRVQGRDQLFRGLTQRRLFLPHDPGRSFEGLLFL